MVKSGRRAREVTSHVMECSQEDTAVGGRSVGLQSGPEETQAACPGCCSSLQAWEGLPRKERKE